MNNFLIFIGILLALNCSSEKPDEKSAVSFTSPQFNIPPDTLSIAPSFAFPVGYPDAKNYYDAQPFRKNNHLGEDWNGKNGGNTDEGDTIYTIANGLVSEANDFGGGWGKVIRVIHRVDSTQYIESLYAHCKEIFVQKDKWVKGGTPIGTIGTADGQYLAHLHFEIRDSIGMPLGGGYGKDTMGYISPTLFLNELKQ